MFWQNRTGRKLLEDEVKAVYRMFSSGTNRIELSPACQADLFRRFSDANQRLLIQHGIPEPK